MVDKVIYPLRASEKRLNREEEEKEKGIGLLL
jgi:hypothetical protein